MRALCVLALTTMVPSALLGQELGKRSEEAIGAATGAFFALSVADLEASARWYREKLGLDEVLRLARSAQSPGIVALEGGGLIVELVEHDASVKASSGDPKQIDGFFKGGMIVADFDKATARLRERGVEIVVGPFPARDTMRANLIFKDNAGNLIQLFGGYAGR